MKLVTKEQIRKMDQRAINEYSIPGVLLMEQAAYSVFKYFEKLPPMRIIIACGPGNNGGDGLALARQLTIWSSHQVSILLVANSSRLTGDAKIYYDICKSMDVTIHEYNSNEGKQLELKDADYLVDALLGTGLSKEVKGDMYQVVEAMNNTEKPIISIDIPSGICADTGKVLGIAIKAYKTITFALPKVGLYIYPGVWYANEVICTEIGIPRQIVDQTSSKVHAITEEEVKRWMPKRHMRSNKGTYGKVLVIGGQRGMSGAVALAAHSAIKIGAGIVTAAVPRAIHDIVEQKLTEVMSIPIHDVDGHFSIDAVADIEALMKGYSVIVVGPGMGRSKESQFIIEAVLKSNKDCIIDADGLYGLKPHLERLKGRKARTVITPHPGELSHLIDVPIEDLLDNPLYYTQKVAREYGLIVVFKIERTMISDGEHVWINTTGNPGLAKGGSGDVLAGMIGGIVAQGLPALEAANISVYAHGKAADRLCETKSIYTFLPSDLIAELDHVFHYL